MTNSNQETLIQNKKRYTLLAVVVIVFAAAAFVGGRLLNGQANPLGFFPIGNGGLVSMAMNIIPAPELPTTQPDATGMLVERKDNAITIQTFSMDVGNGGGIVVSSASAGDNSGTVTTGGNDAPKVEVVVTRETKIYRDVTEFGADLPDENTTFQQVVESGFIDDLKNNTMLVVWGRKNGDRIIADVISYSNPMLIQK